MNRWNLRTPFGLRVRTAFVLLVRHQSTGDGRSLSRHFALLGDVLPAGIESLATPWNPIRCPPPLHRRNRLLPPSFPMPADASASSDGALSPKRSCTRWRNSP